MSELFAYICTSQTAEAFVPPNGGPHFQRDVSDAFYALSGGYRTIGQISFFPLQKSVPHHLLCDGREVPKAQFPELFDYLGAFMGTAADPDNFVLPDYVGAGSLTQATTAAPEVTTANTVTSETSSPGEGNSGGSIDPAVDSGGRVRPYFGSTNPEL